MSKNSLNCAVFDKHCPGQKPNTPTDKGCKDTTPHPAPNSKFFSFHRNDVNKFFFCSGRMMWSYFSPTLNSFLLLLLCLKPFSAKKDPKGGHLENKNAAGGSDIEAAEGGGCQWWPKSSRLTEILNSPLEVFCYPSNGVNFCVVWRHPSFTTIEALARINFTKF